MYTRIDLRSNENKKTRKDPLHKPVWINTNPDRITVFKR